MWNISNLLSMFRVVLAVPMVYALSEQNLFLILLTGAVAIATDVLDGYFARKLNQITELGKIIDPVADKILVGIIALFLIIQGRMPLWFGIAILARDIIILTGGLFAKKKLEFVIPSNYVGKVTVMIIEAVFLGIVLNIKPVAVYGPYVALAALIISLGIYTVNLMKMIKK